MRQRRGRISFSRSHPEAKDLLLEPWGGHDLLCHGLSLGILYLLIGCLFLWWGGRLVISLPDSQCLGTLSLVLVIDCMGRCEEWEDVASVWPKYTPVYSL